MGKHYFFYVIFAFFVFANFTTNVTAYTIPTLNSDNKDSIYTELSENVNVTVNVEKELFPVIAKLLSEGDEHSEEKYNTLLAYIMMKYQSE